MLRCTVHTRLYALLAVFMLAVFTACGSELSSSDEGGGSDDTGGLPVFASSVPQDGSEDISINSSFFFTYDGDISNYADYSYSIKDANGVSINSVISYSAPTLTIVITPLVPLTPGARYFIAFANDLISIVTSDGTQESATDSTAPTIVLLTPVNGTTNVSVGTNVVIAMDETLDPTTVTTSNIIVADSGSNVVAGTISYSSQAITFDPTSNLGYGETYTIRVENLKDTSGNLLATPRVSTFTTETTDTTAPTVTGYTPANGATNVALDSNIQVFFSEALDSSTVSSSNITLSPSASSVYSVASDGTVTINPSSDLSSNTTYTVTVTTGVKDSAGNSIASASSASFTTINPDVTAPTTVSTSPTSGDTGVAITSDITLTFSEPVTLNNAASLKQGSTTVTATISVSGPVLTINPDSNLAYSTVYTVTVTTALTDTATTPNALASTVSYTFTTASAPDTTAPASPSISINDAGASTNSRDVTVDTSATDAFGVTGYYLSETSSTPSASAAGWVTVSSATNYSGTNIAFTMTSSGTGTKTAYVWFKDSAGNISSSANDTITLNPTELVWEYEVSSALYSYPFGIDANDFGAIYVGGQFNWNDELLGFVLDDLSPAPLSVSFDAYNLATATDADVFNDVAMDNNNPPSAYVVGTSSQSSDHEFTVAKITSVGALDTSFDTDGVAFYTHTSGSPDPNDFYDTARGVDVNDRNGDGAIDEIIVTGNMEVVANGQTDIGVVEFNASGTAQWAQIIDGADITISGGGTAADAWEAAYNVVVNRNHVDKYSVVFAFLQIDYLDYSGSNNAHKGDSFLLALDGSGNQYNGFGNNNSNEAGTWIYDCGGGRGRSDFAMAGAFDSAGKLVVVALTNDTDNNGTGSDFDLCLYRTTANAGGLDTTFSSDGVLTADMGDVGNTFSLGLRPSVALDNSDNVYVGYTKHNGTTLDGVVSAYNDAGTWLWDITYDSGATKTAGDYVHDVKVIDDGTSEYLIVAVELADGTASTDHHIYIAKYRLN